MSGPGPAAPPPPLPRRDPHALAVHWAVDSAVSFLVVVIPLAFFGGPLWFSIVVGLVLGVPLAPWTRRLELRGLAARDAPGGEAPG